MNYYERLEYLSLRVDYALSSQENDYWMTQQEALILLGEERYTLIKNCKISMKEVLRQMPRAGDDFFLERLRLRNTVSKNWKESPMVRLYFHQSMKEAGSKTARIRATISFRLFFLSEKIGQVLPQIQKADVRNLAWSIKNIFLTPEPFTFQKGKLRAIVVDPWYGVLSWTYVQSPEDAISLYKAIYKAMGQKLEDGRVICHNLRAKDPFNGDCLKAVERFSGGRNIKRKCPEGTVKFTSAELRLNCLSKPVKICNSRGYLYEEYAEDKEESNKSLVRCERNITTL